mmetsp:Transcript_12932/g.37495  ORF Transcript_12932/g.37495 Transcript_12932/m.37495 type:complete len:82 (+) Transcript_12932:147-392(+)
MALSLSLSLTPPRVHREPILDARQHHTAPSSAAVEADQNKPDGDTDRRRSDAAAGWRLLPSEMESAGVLGVGGVTRGTGLR